MGFLMIIISSFAFWSYSSAERLQERIYSDIIGGAACFRRLNATHQVGCTSPDNGAVGVVQMIENVTDAKWMVFNGAAGPYMAIVNTALFNGVIELFIKNPNKIAGVLLYDDANIKVSEFSQESQCPNEYAADPLSQCSTSKIGGYRWNENGTGLLRRDIPFPIFYFSQSKANEIEKIKNCYDRFNVFDKDNQKGRPLCSVQLSSFMNAAVSTVLCMKRSAANWPMSFNKACDPIGDYNVYYSTFPMIKDSGKKTLLVTGRLDTASMFDGVAPGAASTVVSLVTLITAAKTLNDMVQSTNVTAHENNILWTFFNGEAFDYIGSQRVAYDISYGSWPPNAPLTAGNISLHVELGQVGGSLSANNSPAWPLFAYIPGEKDSSAKVKDFFDQMENNMKDMSLSLTPKLTPNLPPSSLHSFRKILKSATETGALQEVVLVDHEEIFTNKFYHSVHDSYEKINFIYRNISIGFNGTFVPTESLIANGTFNANDMQVKISNLATTLALTLYQQGVGQPYTGNLTASAHLTDELLYCYLKNQGCRLLVAADLASSGDGSAIPVPQQALPLYASVAIENKMSPASLFVAHLLPLLAGTHLRLNRTQCDALGLAHPEVKHLYLKGWDLTGVCIQTTANFTQAISPAFTIPDYQLRSAKYSSWTESVWSTMSARVFVMAGGGGATTAAVCGALATLLTVALTYHLNKHVALLFAEQQPMLVNTDATAGILRTVNC